MRPRRNRHSTYLFLLLWSCSCTGLSTREKAIGTATRSARVEQRPTGAAVDSVEVEAWSPDQQNAVVIAASETAECRQLTFRTTTYDKRLRANNPGLLIAGLIGGAVGSGVAINSSVVLGSGSLDPNEDVRELAHIFGMLQGFATGPILLYNLSALGRLASTKSTIIKKTSQASAGDWRPCPSNEPVSGNYRLTVLDPQGVWSSKTVPDLEFSRGTARVWASAFDSHHFAASQWATKLYIDVSEFPDTPNATVDLGGDLQSTYSGLRAAEEKARQEEIKARQEEIEAEKEYERLWKAEIEAEAAALEQREAARKATEAQRLREARSRIASKRAASRSRMRGIVVKSGPFLRKEMFTSNYTAVARIQNRNSFDVDCKASVMQRFWEGKGDFEWKSGTARVCAGCVRDAEMYIGTMGEWLDNSIVLECE